MPEEIVGQETAPVAETPEVKEEAKSPTLDEVLKQNKELGEKMETIIKQNRDKDSFINQLQNENKSFRDRIEKVSTSLDGKNETQKDAIIEAKRAMFLKEGYDEKSVDLILGTIVDLADRKAQERIVPIVIEAAQELVESDPDIDQSFLQKNQDSVMEEYGLFKQEVSPRKIKANLKKAYRIVKERLADKAKAEARPDNRDDMIDGAKPAQTGKARPQADDLVDSIEKSGGAGGHFI